MYDRVGEFDADTVVGGWWFGGDALGEGADSADVGV